MHLIRNALYCLLTLLLLQSAVGAAPVMTELSTDEIVKRVQAQYPGEVIKITREYVGERWVYRVRMLASGHITEVHVDVHTGDAVNQQERAE